MEACKKEVKEICKDRARGDPARLQLMARGTGPRTEHREEIEPARVLTSLVWASQCSTASAPAPEAPLQEGHVPLYCE